MDLLNALVAFLNFIVVPGLAYGSQLALGALGVTLIFAVLRFSNFAHGDTMAFGTAFVILFTWWFQSMGISFGPLPTALLALPFGILCTIAMVLVTDRMVYRYYRKVRAKSIIVVIVSAGVMFVMNGLVRMIIGTSERNFTDGARMALNPQDFKAWSGLAEPLAIKTTAVISVVAAAACVAALFWFLQKTRTGKSMRAYSDNEDLALLSGINPERVVMITWIIAGSLACIAGTLYGLDKSFRVFVYFGLLLPIFAAAIVGGLGSPLGAIVGGYIVAFSELIVTNAWRKIGGYIAPESWLGDGLYQALSTDYKVAVSFVILIIVLLFRPQGIFGGK
jgi:branched-chain amino acid transport system permease protein